MSERSRRTVMMACVAAVTLVGGCAPEATPPAAVPSGPAVTTTAAQPAPTASPAPGPAATGTTAAQLPDGSVAAVDGGLDGGLLFIVWDGTRERIEQPAPFDAATIEDLGLQLQEPIERLTAMSEPDPRNFWVVHPPEGGKARLHLAVADRLYPVETVPAEQHQIDELGVPDEPLLNRMRPADD